MTTIFAFKAKNAWVLVADRFATEQASLTNEKFEGRPYRTLLVDIDEKIFNKDNLVFSGCGDQHTITRVVMELSKNCSTLDECKGYIFKKLTDTWFSTDIVDRPHLLIISRTEQCGIIVNFTKQNNQDKIEEISQFVFLGGGEASLNKVLVKQEIKRFFNSGFLLEKSKLTETAIQCAKWLDTLWLGLHKDDLKLTGPPSFIGCDVCIVWEDDCKEINVQPKNYEIV